MIEFVVIFLVVLSCCGVLFTVLLFLPKAWMKVRAFLLGCSSKIDAFFADWSSRLRVSFADWRASANQKREQFRLDGKRRWLERDRLYREQSHLLPGWDWNGLVVSVCGLLGGLVLMGVSASEESVFRHIFESALEDEDSAMILWMELGMPSAEEMWEKMRWYAFLFELGCWIVFLSFPCVLVSGFVFCRRYFSEEARYRRIVDREEGLKAERRRREGRQDD